jgi:hypothetical protein
MQVVESGNVMALGMRHGDGGVWVQVVVVFDELQIGHPSSLVRQAGDWTARARALAGDSCSARTSFGMMLGGIVKRRPKTWRLPQMVSGQDAERAAEQHGLATPWPLAYSPGFGWPTRNEGHDQIYSLWNLQVQICVCLWPREHLRAMTLTRFVFLRSAAPERVTQPAGSRLDGCQRRVGCQDRTLVARLPKGKTSLHRLHAASRPSYIGERMHLLDTPENVLCIQPPRYLRRW